MSTRQTVSEADLARLLAAGAEVVLRVRDRLGNRLADFEASVEGLTLAMTQRRTDADPAGVGARQLRRLAQKAVAEGGTVDLEARPRPSRTDR